MRILVTGGVRSGKSAHAESLLADRDHVTYVATGPEATVVEQGAERAAGRDHADDAAWAARVRAHRERRPAHWSTSREVPASGPVLLDSLGTWVAAQVDDLDGWTTAGWQESYAVRVDALLASLSALDELVVVTDEVGLGGVGAEAGARLFADLLGELNQRVGALVDAVHLVVAGRVVRL